MNYIGQDFAPKEHYRTRLTIIDRLYLFGRALVVRVCRRVAR